MVGNLSNKYNLIKRKLLVVGYWMLDTGCWILDAGYSGYWLLVAAERRGHGAGLRQILFALRYALCAMLYAPCPLRHALSVRNRIIPSPTFAPSHFPTYRRI